MGISNHSVVIIGTGSIGERHLRCFLGTQRARVSFVEPQDDLANTILERYPQARREESIDSAIANGVTCAVIATPAPLHLPQAQQFVTQNISVLIEKPLSISLQGLDEFRQACRNSSAAVAVAYVHRANPILSQMREAIQTGRYGLPLELIACCGQNFPTYRPAYAQTYYAHRKSGGGAVQDALTHIINAGEWLVGPIDRVVGDVSHQQLPGVKVEDTTHVLARHGNVLASYVLNQFQAPNELTLTVNCERATLRCEVHKNRWRVMTRPDGDWEDHQLPTLERDTLFIRQADAFLDVLDKQTAPLCSLDEAISTLHANLAILQSADAVPWQIIPHQD